MSVLLCMLLLAGSCVSRVGAVPEEALKTPGLTDSWWQRLRPLATSVDRGQPLASQNPTRSPGPAAGESQKPIPTQKTKLAHPMRKTCSRKAQASHTASLIRAMARAGPATTTMQSPMQLAALPTPM